jgi:putative DNA primase/helicase
MTCAINPGEWKDKFLPAGMFGKLLNIAGELSENKKIDGARFKEITCGETITGQHKQGQPFDFNPMCAHWFSSNHAPKSDDSDDGFARRWLFFTFNKRLATWWTTKTCCSRPSGRRSPRGRRAPSRV